MIRQMLVGVAVAILGFGLASCGDIPSCEEVACSHPAGAYEFDGIFVPVNDPMPSGETTAAGAARG
jgi:hypothetical protein